MADGFLDSVALHHCDESGLLKGRISHLFNEMLNAPVSDDCRLAEGREVHAVVVGPDLQNLLLQLAQGSLHVGSPLVLVDVRDMLTRAFF